MSCFQLCTVINEGWGRLVCHRLQHKPNEGVQHLLRNIACLNIALPGSAIAGHPPHFWLFYDYWSFFQSKARSRCRDGDAEAGVGSSFPQSDCADFGRGVESFFYGRHEILQFVSP